MPSLEPLLPPNSTLGNIAQTHTAWRLSAIARGNPSIAIEYPDVHNDFGSIFTARNKLKVLAELTHERKMATEVIRSHLSHGEIQGLSHAALRKPDPFKHYHGRQVELSYWHVPLIDTMAFENGKDIARQVAGYAIHLFDLDPYEDGVWMTVQKVNLVKQEMCESLGMVYSGLHLESGRLLYSGLAGLIAESRDRPDVVT